MRIGLLLITLSMVTGCAVGPNYVAPKAPYSAKWHDEQQHALSTKSIDLQWWRSFHDRQLSRYIHKAVKRNPDVNIALNHLYQERALRNVTFSVFLPKVDAEGNTERSKTAIRNNFNRTRVMNIFDGRIDGSWQIDLFGGNRRALEASHAAVDAAFANYDDVIRLVIAETAKNYYEARGWQKQILVTKKNIDLFYKTLKLVEKRQHVGESSQFDLERARGQYQSTRATLPTQKANLRSAVYRLSVLLGEPPEALLKEMHQHRGLPHGPRVVALGLRSELLRRRPDVRRAERDLAAATANIGVETSAMFPKLILNGDIGTEASALNKLFKTGAGFWSIAGNISTPLFAGGAIHARIEAAKYAARGAFENYRKTVLTALMDAETALSLYHQEQITQRRLAALVKTRRKAVGLAVRQYEIGEQDYLAVLDADRELVSSENSLVASETKKVIHLISLYEALGGGWTSRAQPVRHSEASAGAPASDHG